MKKFTLLLFLMLTTLGYGQLSTTPSPAIASGQVTLNFNKAGTPMASYTGTIYAHIGVTVDGQRWQNVRGSWGVNSSQPTLTLVSGTTYSLTLGPDLYTYFGVPTTSTISEICVVLRAATNSPQTTDAFLPVGAFQLNLTAPAANSTTIINSGSNFTVSANNTNGNAVYSLSANGTVINTATTANYSYTHNAVTTNQSYTLTVTQGAETITRSFNAVVNPNTVNEAMPQDVRDGINYHDNTSQATLVLNAPNKDFVYVAGSFNNWQPSTAYAMKKDPATGKFWLQLTGLTAGQIETFQYWVVDQTPVATSQAMVKTADPFSTLVLSPFDDPYLTAAEYPNLPPYPAGQNFEVSVLQTGQTPYNWQVTDFVRPAKEDLIIYETLIRDFDSNKTWDGLAARIDYFKGLNVNAIQLMPVMEFEGNISWGYNTAYHMALDKAYGTADSMKAFIDLCHQNGIAVILDLALNHVYGRSPLNRMWCNDPDGDGFGATTTENPYCNVAATHTYSVGTDLNHQNELTQYYSERVIEHWMTEFKIDGYRWDLTKGFTQVCGNVDNTCTEAYQADRVAILKQYADYQWNIDPDFYVIFEHLGGGSGPNSSAAEETEWANYRVGEGKGIMLWANNNYQYNQLSMGYVANSNFSSMDFENRGFTAPRAVGYAESHDEERLMYKNLTSGAAVLNYSARNLATALERTKAIGAVFLTVPGPKMIWQYAELGFDYGINRCADNTYANACRTDPKPVASEIGYTTDASRMAVYDVWSQINSLRLNNPVFKTTTFTITAGTLTPRIDIWDNNIPETELKAVIVLANFGLTPQTVNTNFSIAGDWYNLMDGTTISSTTATLTLQPGEYRIFGNRPAALKNDGVSATKAVLYPNPANTQFSISTAASKVEVYAITGQLVKTFGANASGAAYDISTLVSGIYLVKITDSNNRQSTIKLVKE
ncbi:T9SS type A sorting domain-containing protein [Flavobacterium sp. Sd200]|uniref:alpha-amylase family glycosyl hydrolase n=1 Tax=Flavobacterium sp. Sd200 TaxID=2692211 RepID=UPI00136B5EB0|nr:alpha-amylase family glycosyl hydrolase [Flavobacterium sp. Sd200]MXN91221.1 T9SS type A sorting domain-containing protein [Flavobacterium sp. Sd200]